MQGDLISRSELLKWIPFWGGDIESMLEYIANMETAYSVEDVIEQTHKIFVDELEIIEKGIPEGGEYTEEAYRMLYLNKCVSDAIRNGGKE